MTTATLVIQDAQVVTAAGHTPPVKGAAMAALQVLENGWVACVGTRIAAVGTEANVCAEVQITSDTRILCGKGKVVTPGLVDPHTHLVFAGSREEEFAQRSQGAEYMDILRAGGGILATVAQTRAASAEELYRAGHRYLDWMLRQGTTMVECKSGYGLDLMTERKQLQVVKRLHDSHAVDLTATFLGAHAWPPEYKGREEEYVDLILNEILPCIVEEGLARYCDVFCEEHVFSLAQSRRILQRASDLGLGLRVHADELTDMGGAQLAAELGAASADHLLQISDAGIQALGEAEVMPILLPATSFTLGKPYAPARGMLAAGLPLALATDFNPGSSPTPSLPLVMALGCLYLQMTPEEVLHAVTINAAHSLGCSDQYGSIEVGKQADFVVFDVDAYGKIPYFFGAPTVETVIKGGRIVVEQ